MASTTNLHRINSENLCYNKIYTYSPSPASSSSSSASTSSFSSSSSSIGSPIDSSGFGDFFLVVFFTETCSSSAKSEVSSSETAALDRERMPKNDIMPSSTGV